MSNIAKIAIAIVLGVILIILSVIFSSTKWSDSITATVVDKETNQPIEGVVVVADWMINGGLEGSLPTGHMAVMEAVTDSNGRFHFPSWGPRFTFAGGIRAEQPELFIFKSGYGYVALDNRADDRWHGMYIKSIADGTTIKLEKFRGTRQDYVKNVTGLVSGLDSNLYGHTGQCGWKHISRMIRAVYEQDKLFRAHGPENSSALIRRLSDSEEFYAKLGCGSAKEFLKEIIK